MTSRVSRACAVAALAATSGCLPIPWTLNLSPAIDGQYVDDAGRPLGETPLLLSTRSGDTRCEQASVRAVTTADGRFSFPAQTRRMRFMPLMPVDFFPTYYVCASGDGGMANFVGRPDRYQADRSVSLVCARSTTPGTPALTCAARDSAEAAR